MAVGRQFGREATIYLAGFVGAGILQFLAIPIYSRALGPEQYGYLTLTIAATTVLSGVMILGGDVALARFWVDAKTEDEKRILASTWIGFLTVWSVVVALLASLAAPWLADLLRPGTNLAVLLTIGFLGLVPAQLSRMLAQILRNQYRPTPFAFTTVLVAVGNVGIGIALGVGLGLGVYGIVLGTLVGEAIGCLIRLPLVRRALGRRLSKPDLGPLLRFGVPLVPASLAAWVLNGADRLVLSVHATESELGAYGLAVSAMGPFTVMTVALGQAWIPRISQTHADDEDRARRAMAVATVGATAGYLIVATAAGAMAPSLVGILGGTGYESAAEALPLLTLGAGFLGTSLFASTGMVLVKRTGLIPLVTISSAFLDLALLALLVPRWGALGAATAVAVTYLVLATLTQLLSAKVFALQLPSSRLAVISLAAILQTAVSTIRPDETTVIAGWIVTTTLIGAVAYSVVRPGDHPSTR